MSTIKPTFIEQEILLKEYIERNYPTAINFVLVVDTGDAMVRIGKHDQQNEGMLRSLLDNLQCQRIAQFLSKYVVEAK